MRISQNTTVHCIAYLGCYAVLLLLPLLQLGLKPLPELTVHGIQAPKHAPTFTAQSFLNGKFQIRAENWFLKRNGLWGWMVRACNELTYRVFSQVSLNYGTTVLVGNDGQFFQPMYLRSFNKTKRPKADRVQKRVQDLKALQELLESRGIAFSLLISTNVPALYPELIPAAYTDPTRNSRQNSYDIARPLLDRYEVNYIDGHELLQGMKGEYPFRLFQNTASHWNRVASCRVTDALAAQLSELTGKSVSRIPCLPITVDPKPRDFDQDLLEIANLLFPESTHRPAPYPPDSAADDMPKGEKLKILMVGTSFSYSILGNLRRYQISDAYKLYFYYRQLHIGPGKNVGINHRRINWDRDVFSHDAIIIETNVSGIGNAGFKFVSDALSKLRQGQ